MTHQALTVYYPYYPAVVVLFPPERRVYIQSVISYIVQCYQVDPLEIAINLSERFVPRNYTSFSDSEAMDMIRKVNAHPDKIGRKRSEALARVQTIVCDETHPLLQLPCWLVAAAVLNDLDLGLFNGLLRNRILIRTGSFDINEDSFTKHLADRGAATTMSAYFFDDGDPETELVCPHPTMEGTNDIIAALIYEMCCAYRIVHCLPDNLELLPDSLKWYALSGYGPELDELVGMMQKMIEPYNWYMSFQD